jgi:serine/threonine protein kinase
MEKLRPEYVSLLLKGMDIAMSESCRREGGRRCSYPRSTNRMLTTTPTLWQVCRAVQAYCANVGPHDPTIHDLRMRLNYDQTNILIKQGCRACLADFGLSTIVGIERRAAASASLTSVASKPSLVSFTAGGTTRWMSPELLDPDRFGITDYRPTKQSDCYALGMVVYEVRADAIVPTFATV